MVHREYSLAGILPTSCGNAQSPARRACTSVEQVDRGTQIIPICSALNPGPGRIFCEQNGGSSRSPVTVGRLRAHTEGLAPPRAAQPGARQRSLRGPPSERNGQLCGRHGDGPKLGGGDLLGGRVRRPDRLGSGSARRAQYAFEDRTDPGFAGHQGASHDEAAHQLAARRHHVLRGHAGGAARQREALPG